VILDQGAWGIPSWGSSLNFAQAINQLQTSHLDPRRIHLYTTHGGGPNSLIPEAQPIAPSLTIGAIDASPISGNQAEEFIQLINCSSVAIDLSGFYFTVGPVLGNIPKGCVVPPGDSIYLTSNVQAFRSRTTGPRGGQGLFVVRAYTGDLQAAFPIQLFTATGVMVIGGPSFNLTTSGVQDVNLQVQFAAPFSELYIPISANLASPFGCGPFAGLGADALFTVFYPIGTHPFHVQANAQGQYTFALPAGTLPAGVTIDSRVIAFSTQGLISMSPIVRITF
jgi:hypothetical protein